jgi:alkylation response protein AidB-like acyl-CoA dehydrogenase
MDFNLSNEQRMLADAAGQFAKKTSPVERFRKLRSTSEREGTGWEPAVWKQMAELGWLGLFFPEDVGGLGLSFFDASLVLQKLATTLVPEPYLSSVVFAGSAVLHGATKAQAKELLEPMIEGKTSLALAWAERQSRYDASDVTTTAKADGSGFVLTGEKIFVLNGDRAETLIVTARAPGGVSLFAVDAKDAGVSVQRIKTMDGLTAGLIRFEVAKARLLGTEGGGAAALEIALDYAAAGACAEGYGLSATMLDMTNNYLKQRKQFGVAIGSFQALQHRTVDMFVRTQLLESTSILAAMKVDDADVEERRRAVSIAKVQLAIGGKFVSQQAIQLHGGIGVTDEHDVGLYFKRMTVLNALFGDEEHHLGRFVRRPGFTEGVFAG